MKKFILFASVFAGLFAAASCQQEKLEPEMNGGVTYEISLPTAPQTKGEGGYEKYDLHYEVYKTANASALETAPLLFEKTVPMEGNKTTVTLDLLNDQDYTILFWANKANTDYFDLGDLRKVGVKQASANNDDRDAFCGKDQIIQHDGAQTKTVTLTRPFAQVNIGTIVPSQTQIGYDVTPSKSYVKISDIPTAFNVFTGLPEGQATAVEFSTADEPANIPGGYLKVNDDESSYRWVAMNYIVVPESVVEVYYEITTANGVVKNTINNVPVKKNYRTNIIGNLLTSNATYNIEILPGFEGDNGAHVELLADGLVRNINGDYEISSAIGLAHAINNLFVDANGVANDKTFYIKPGIYDMAEQSIKDDITVKSGTLKVYDTEAVVTRSVTIGGVIIEGLDKAIINTVEEGATVFFSGIIVQDFKGEDGVAALVQNNEGKVVLADCQIVDETGAPEQGAILVDGNNDPVVVEKVEEEAGELIYTAEQLAAAFADETVESIALGADIALENVLVFPEGRTATLDLRGWELTIADQEKVATTYVINNHGTLTIKDSYETGAVNARGIYNGYVADGDPVSTAKLTIINGTFNAKGDNGGAAVFNYGQVEIKGGTFTSIGGYSLNNQSGATMTIAEGVKANNGIYNSGATLTINGGKIEGNRSGCHVVYAWNSTVTINGGTIHNNNSGNSTLMAAGTSEMTVNGGTISIKDGRVEGNGNTWTSCLTDTQNTAKLTVNGGTFNGGFRVQGGTTMTIIGGVFNDVVGSGYNVYEGSNVVITGASFNYDVNKWCHKDYKAVKNAETAMWDVVKKVYVAKIGEDGYESLQEAVEAVEDGETITFVADVEQVDGTIITDKNITVDLNGKTFTVSEGANTNNRNFKINGSSVVTIKNGVMVAAAEYSSGAYGTVRTEGTANVTLNNVELYNYRGNGLNVKALSGTTVTINDSEIYSQYGGGIESAGGEVVLNNVKVDQKGMYTAPYNSMAISVNGGGKVTVNSGVYSTVCLTAEEANNQGTSHGPWVAGVLNSGGTLIINGGTFSNDNFGDNSLATYARGLLLADTGANIQINGGTFNGVKAIVDVTNNLGDASRNPSVTLAGGDFSADPQVSGLYASHLISVADGCVVKETEDGRFTIGRPVAKVGSTEYGSIDEAVAAWTNNTTLTLLADVTLSGVVTIKSTEHHILDLGTYTMTAAEGMNAFVIQACGTGASERTAITIKADSTKPGCIDAGKKSIVYYNYADGGISGDDRPIIKIEGGVFKGGTSSFGTSVGIYFKGGSAARQAATLNISGGEFFCAINGQSKSKLLISGGVFHYSVGSQGDSTALRLISGGTFKTLGFMTADSNNTKFWFGTSMGNSNVGVYVNDDNYLVVGGPVITEFGDKFVAKATNSTSWNSLLQYSSAAANGLYYTNAELAIKKHGEANVELK